MISRKDSPGRIHNSQTYSAYKADMRSLSFAGALVVAHLCAGCAAVTAVGAVGAIGFTAVSTAGSLAVTGASATLSGAGALVKAATPSFKSDDKPTK